MAKIYARWIQAGRLTPKDVPPRWLAETAELLGVSK